ncbi:MAG TPA: hypothetical protein VG846_13950 [Actinomycetota bacterium]|jgi:hypothetical protein|nr:hypothetical protein [Actinomycetota bacterium]
MTEQRPEDEVEGHVRRPRLDDEAADEDVEGHGTRKLALDDDVEGHSIRNRAQWEGTADPDEDVEGHGRTRL